MKKIHSAAIALVAVFFAASGVYAYPADAWAKSREEGKGAIVKELKLTPEQENKLEENRKTQHETMANLFEAMRVKQEKLRQELKSPTVTKAALEPLANEIKALQAQLLDARINGIFAVKEILTPEQFAKFQQMTQERQKNRKGRSGNRRNKPMGHDQYKE